MQECLLCSKKIELDLNLFLLLTGYVPIRQRLCLGCWEKFERVGMPYCLGCGRQLLHAKICLDCQKWQRSGMALMQNQALYQYNQQMKDYMARYKFIGDYRLAVIFAKEMQRTIRKRMKKEEIDFVQAIPLSAERERQRGFNQVSAFIPSTIKSFDLLAVRSGHKVDQSAKSRAGRLRTKQPFELKTDQQDLVQGARILLVDDVYTTGRTLYHAASLLFEAGAEEIMSQTLAR